MRKQNLLNKGGVAVIGSRDADEGDLNFTQHIGKETALQGYSIVQVVHAVDQSAMMGALDNEGTAIGVMADSLLKATSSAKYRNKIMSGDLVLISHSILKLALTLETQWLEIATFTVSLTLRSS